MPVPMVIPTFGNFDDNDDERDIQMQIAMADMMHNQRVARERMGQQPVQQNNNLPPELNRFVNMLRQFRQSGEARSLLVIKMASES